jgi:enamine deaminase RidA (YjgF/YER057c/UK114 family)
MILGPENIVKLATFPIRADFIKTYGDARVKVLGDIKPPNTLLVVHALDNPERLIEIEAYAAKP